MNIFWKRGLAFYRPQGHLPRLISDWFWQFLFDEPGSEEHSFMCHSFMCLFGALTEAHSVPEVHRTRRALRHPPRCLLYVMLYCFRDGNRPSGPDFGRTATGNTPKSALRPAFGRPEGRFPCFPNSPAKIWPGRPMSAPEALSRDIK